MEIEELNTEELNIEQQSNTEELNIEQPLLQTPRLLLRKLTLNDLEDMYAYTSSDDVMKYVPFPTHQSLADTRVFIEYVLEQYANKLLAPWGIELKENGAFIGTIEYAFWEPGHHTAELATVLSQDYWGKGIITESTTEVIKYGFESLDLIRIQARCFAENIASQRVLEKVGMTLEGTLRKSLLMKGKQRDIKLYSILKEEFLAT